jgi:hypothetical protein
MLLPYINYNVKLICMLRKKYLLYTLMQIAIKMNKNLQSAFIVGISSILLLAAGVEVITFQTVFAQTTTPTIQSDINATAALSTILGEPFFIDRGSEDTGTRVLSIKDPVQTEDSYIANVTIKDVGNATDTGTFITTYEPNEITTSIGQGIITSSDGEIATYTAKDLGVTNEKGERIYRGIQIFSTNSTGKLSFMDNLVGLYIYEDNPDGSRKSGKIWEWK